MTAPGPLHHEPVVAPWLRRTKQTLTDAWLDDQPAPAPEGSTPMAVFAVFYTYDSRLDEQQRFQPAHRGYLRELMDQGVCLAAGRWVDDTKPGALLLFRAPSAHDVADLLRIDPYVVQGLVTNADIREWSAALGPFAA